MPWFEMLDLRCPRVLQIKVRTTLYGIDLGGQRPLDGEECAEVIGHVEDYLRSGMTVADAEDLRASVAEVAPELGLLEIEEIMRVVLRRSCCERAPESLRVRISTQIAVWRTEF